MITLSRIRAVVISAFIIYILLECGRIFFHGILLEGPQHPMGFFESNNGKTYLVLRSELLLGFWDKRSFDKVHWGDLVVPIKMDLEDK